MDTVKGLVVILSLLGLRPSLAGADPPGTPAKWQFPPIRTIVVGPAQVDTVSLPVPADRSVPETNFSCRAKRGGIYNCALPAKVDHTKTEACPDSVARLLAEQTAIPYEQTVPLTIFGPWQWDYSFDMCQVETALYTIPSHGSWEICYEASLTQSVGHVDCQWLYFSPDLAAPMGKVESFINVNTFSSLRKRDGYPIVRELSR